MLGGGVWMSGTSQMFPPPFALWGYFEGVEVV